MKTLKVLDAVGFGVFIGLLAVLIVVLTIAAIAWAVSSGWWLPIIIGFLGVAVGSYAGVDYYNNPPPKRKKKK